MNGLDISISDKNMLFFYTNLLGLDQLHDYKPEDRLAKSDILEKLKEMVKKKIKQSGGGSKKKKNFKKTLKKNKKTGGNPSKRERDQTFYTENSDEKPQESELKRMKLSSEIKDILIKNYLYEIIYSAFGYINLDNDINSELIISLQNLALYLDSYKNDIRTDENYDNDYKNELLINIEIGITVIHNLVTNYLDIAFPIELVNFRQMSEQQLDLSPSLLKDDEDMLEPLDELQDDASDQQLDLLLPLLDDEDMSELQHYAPGSSSMQIGGTNIDNFQSNINNLIENKYFDIDIENIINNVIDDNSKKRQIRQRGGAPKQKLDNNTINMLIKHYYEILKKNLDSIKKFFIQDQSSNFYIPDLNINATIIKKINEYDNNDNVKNNNFDDETDTSNEYINTKLFKFLAVLFEYSKLVTSQIPMELQKLGGEFDQKFKYKRNYFEFIATLLGVVQSNNQRDINDINKNTQTINSLFVQDVTLKDIIYSTDVLLKNIINVNEIIEREKEALLNEKEKEARAKARAKAKAEAKKIQDAIDDNNKKLTFALKIEERKMANNILIFIGKIVKQLLQPLGDSINLSSIEMKQYKLLNHYADINYNSVDKNVYGKLEESLLKLFQDSGNDLVNRLEDLSSNIYNRNIPEKCYFINNAAQGTFGDGSELQQYRYCPLGSLIDAAALMFGGCTYNAPIGKKVNPPDNNENYIETGDVDIYFNRNNSGYSYGLKIDKLNNNEYDISINYKLNSHEFQTNYRHNINNSSISASNIYKNLLELFTTTLRDKPGYTWNNFSDDLSFQTKFLAESTKKGLGDFLQTVNTVFKNGGFIKNSNYSRGANIIKFDDSGDAPRLNLATDQISSCLLLYIANNFPENKINKYCWGGYKSSSKLLIKKKPIDIDSFTGGKKRTLKKYKKQKNITKKRKIIKKLKKTNKFR